MSRRMRRAMTVLLAAVASAGALAIPAPPASAGGPVNELGTVTHIGDGDTVTVRTSRGEYNVRLVGVQAYELTTYAATHQPWNWRGQCHAVEAARRLRELTLGKQVRVTARNSDSRSGTRYWRNVAVYHDGAWRNVSTIMTFEGHALFNAHGVEYTHNYANSRAAQQARAARRGIYNPTYCGWGPSQGAAISISVRYDAEGSDGTNVNGEWVRVRNGSPYAVSIGGWHVRDNAYRGHMNVGYTFPSWAKVPANGYVTLHVGRGTNTSRKFFWGNTRPIFENPGGAPVFNGDGAYLTDPQLDIRASRMWPNRL